MDPRVKDKPLGVCSVCHALTDQHEYLNQRCHGTFQGRRCYGTYKSGVSALWDRCEGCQGAAVRLGFAPADRRNRPIRGISRVPGENRRPPMGAGCAAA